MDRCLCYVRLAGELRRTVTRLADAGNTLVELQQGQIAADLCDVELNLIRLHNEILELAEDPGRSARRKQPPSLLDHPELPF